MHLCRLGCAGRSREQVGEDLAGDIAPEAAHDLGIRCPRPRIWIAEYRAAPVGTVRWAIIGARSRVATRRLANSVTLCDDHDVFFLAASGQIRIRMAADR
jgi:hypothetical protein